ncbi:hypothetical protein SAMN02927895_04648 [Belnapia rosea]|nr:hypothetical protein SAMN02927895_04648 [Belnapia rosea]
MCHKKHTETTLPSQLTEESCNLSLSDGIEARCRLVGEEKDGIEREDTREGKAL